MTPIRKRRKLTHEGDATRNVRYGSSSHPSCAVCRLPHLTKLCPIIKGNVRIDDAQLPSKAILTLPDSLVARDQPDGTYEIQAKQSICKGTQFGPLEAPRTTIFNPDWKYTLRLFNDTTNDSVYLDTHDPNKCNWMTLVRFCSVDSSQRNCICYQLETDIYFTVVEEIPSGDPLVVSYSPGYQAMLDHANAQVKALVDSLKASSSESESDSDDDDSDVSDHDGDEHDYTYSSTSTLATAVATTGPIRRSQRLRNAKLLDEDFVDTSVEENVMENAFAGESNHSEIDNKESSNADVDASDDENVNLAESFKDEDYEVKPEIEDEDIPNPVSPASLETKRKEKLKRLGPVLAKDEWECKFCISVFDKIEDFSVHLINHYKTVGAARTEKARISKKTGSGQEFEDDAEAHDALGLRPNEEEGVEVEPSAVDIEPSEVDIESSTVNTVPSPSAVDTELSAVDAEPSASAVDSEPSAVNTEPSALDTESSSVVTGPSAVETGPSAVNAEPSAPDTEPSTLALDTEPSAAEPDEPSKPDDTNDHDSVKPDPDPPDPMEIHYTETDSAADPEPEMGPDEEKVEVKEEPIDVESEAEDNADNSCVGYTDALEADPVPDEPSEPKPKEEPKYPYTCDICVSNRVFNRAEYLIRHLKKHSGEFFCFECGQLHKSAEGFTTHKCEGHGLGKRALKIAKCTMCKKVFRSLRHLNHHLQMEHGKTFNCTACTKVFLEEEKVASHQCRGKPPTSEPLTLETAEELYLCSICKESFPLVTQLENHMRVHGCTIVCPICDKSLSHNRLKVHMLICDTLQSYSTGASSQLRCPTCKKVCEDVHYFRDHMTKHTHPFMCPICTLGLSSIADLKAHECTTFQCDGCDESFEKFIDLKKHVNSSHPDVENFCYECAIPFVTENGFNNHKVCEFDPIASTTVETVKTPRKRLPKNQNGDFICETCGATYKKLSSLKTHRQTHGPKRFLCKTCGKSFHRREMLTEHEFVHQAPQFECGECGKKMKSKKSLQIHSQIHTGVKRFKCGQCDRAFIQKVNLISHEMTHAPRSERDFQCPYCSKRFGSKEYLGFHIEAHETGANQVCDLCNLSFVKPHMLMQHKRATHGTQRYICEFCHLTVRQKHSLRRHLEKRHEGTKAVWGIPGYLEGRFDPGAGGFVRPKRIHTFTEYEENENHEDEMLVLGEMVEEEQCIEDSIIDSTVALDEMQPDANLLPKFQVILADTDGCQNLVEFDGQELERDSDGNIIIPNENSLMILRMEEGQLMLSLAHHAQMGQILQLQDQQGQDHDEIV